ncbi:phosphotransferase [Oryctes borbonicus]|uniref:Tyrosine-protein kinase n=1 Tax=Oryctes borbonicus TaxID=1629725 RepID=A0A0T6B3B8_9SCAR|nr:phosphotransferase [Oryctes borbonicus]
MGNLCCSPSQGSPAKNFHKTPFEGRTSIVSDPNPRYHPDPKRNNVDFVRSRVAKSGRTRVVVAQYSYMARDANDVSFHKGDRMEVLDDSDGDWLKVCHLTTNIVGFIPENYVAEESAVQSKDWFMENVSRKEADKLLMNTANSRGTFLVRPSEHNPEGYSLSVKDWDDQRGYHVKHYKIKPLDNGGFYISTNNVYPTLSALVEAYAKNAFGLCHVLSHPCPKPTPQMWDLGPTYKDKWEIPRDEIVLGRILGKGNFGEVYLGRWKDSKDVAVKTLKQGTMSTQAFLEEAAIMKKFRHNRLVALYGVCSKEEPIYIVQEYMRLGSLLDVLRKDQGKTLDFRDLIYIAAQVASGMKYLESKQLIHRDLAARNVLIGDNNTAKISDFGLARVMDDDQYQLKHNSRFPIKWTAPEGITKGIFSIKSDVWSYGILLMELFTYGQVPYPGMTGPEVVELVLKGYRMPKPNNPKITEDIYRIMLTCWDAKPENRPTFEFLTHYFEEFDVTTELPYKEVDY